MLALVWWLACPGSRVPADLPVHTLAFGGDVTLGRGLNEALYDPDRRARIFAEVAGTLRGADLALVNAEGVIAGGGRFYDKGESRPYAYRAHPVAMDVLADAGIDLLAVGNNHVNDYGPFAMREMLDRARIAGLDYVGGGHHRRDARRPVFRQVGDTVVAFVGADLTFTQMHAAGKEHAGTLWLPGLDPKRHDAVMETLGRLLKRARRHADLVFFTPHWGLNWQDEPSEATRTLARRIIDAGYDGILGHSAHRLQGVELIDGKPVVYDAGNFVNDYGPPPRDRHSAVFVLDFNRAGVTSVRVEPAILRRAQTVRAEGRDLTAVLDRMTRLSEALGTPVIREDGTLRIACEPGSLRPRRQRETPPVRDVPATPRLAPPDLVLDTLPDTATKASVRFEGGLELVGYEVLMKDLRVPKAGNVVTLYLRATEPVPDDLWVLLEGERRTEPDATPEYDRQHHLPGDWLLPGSQWPTGAIVR
ncbi:MAG: CapA family protein, partial [Myxococcota bacterium]